MNPLFTLERKEFQLCDSRRLRKKAQDTQVTQDAILRFSKFSVSVALTMRLRFLRFLRFSVYYAIYNMNWCFWDFWGFQFQSRWQGVWDLFVQRGLGILYYYWKGSQAGGYQGPSIIPPKAFRILVRICSQVPCQGTKCPSCCMR